MLQRVVHDFMVKWIGEDWKTTINGYLVAFMGFATTLTSWLAEHAIKNPRSFGAWVAYVTSGLDLLCLMARVVVGHWQIDAKP